MRTKLIITIDTEEEGLWSGSFSVKNNTAKNVAGVAEFQAICDNHNIQPVYLINTPVLEDSEAVNLLRIIIEDDGPGMSAETVSKIFDPFFSTRATGSGLGMAITLQLVEQMGGEIKIDSKETVGTTVSVVFKT